MLAGTMSDQDAIAVLRARVSSIPADLKALFAVVDDPELTDELRCVGAAAIFYNLNPSNLIPAKEGALGLADDAIAIRCALDEVRQKSPDRAKKHAAAAPETWDGLEAEVELLSKLLGDLWQPMRDAWSSIGMQEWRGKKAKDCIADPEESAWLYAAVDEEMSMRDIDDNAVIREVQKAPLIAKLQARLGARKSRA
jgi:uncharacterized membrane protein YkvA (DUF1232 family)